MEGQTSLAAAAAERGGGGAPATSSKATQPHEPAPEPAPVLQTLAPGAAPAASRRMSVMKPSVKNEQATRKYSMSIAGQQDAPEVAQQFPKAPCFGATLSPAAQFSTFKCYEDLIEEKLNETFPDRSWTLPPRCLTPEKTIVLHITPEDAMVITSDPASTKLPQSPLLEQGLPTDAEEPQAKATAPRQPAADGAQWPRLPPPPPAAAAPVPIKQLNVTKRFQVAMDMIDSMKKTRGQLPTSPRVVEKYLTDPDSQPPTDEDGEVHVNSFKTWNSLWTKEFRL